MEKKRSDWPYSVALKALAFFAALACSLAAAWYAGRYLLDAWAELQDAPYTRNLVIAIAFAVAALVLVVYLMCAAGHRRGEPGVQPGWGSKIPLEIDLAATGGVYTGLIALFAEGNIGYDIARSDRQSPEYQMMLLAVFALLAVCVVFTIALLMSIAVRIKCGRWWRTTLCFWILFGLWKLLKLAAKAVWAVLKAFGRFLRAIGCGIRGFFRALPLVWKGVLFVIALFIAETVVAFNIVWNDFAPVWFLGNLALSAFVIFVMIGMRRLQKGGRALAEGDLSYQVDTKHMLWDFKKHGEDLNRIAEGVNLAVEQRMKSDRMKTDLITNVSHDIKTPITSIINYSDLIGKTEDSGEIREYAEVLKRQSEKLKKLLEDLIEASKASTGNLDVILAPSDARVLLTQADGEYGEKLRTAGLDLVVQKPEESVRILVDGRRIWRVFDNLLNNAVKYSQPGTRVWLTLEKKGGEAVFTFRNTSSVPLNISADELMERFVRGDASRSAEGSGLGLSIAKSLTALQHGTMDVDIDGDLFKVILRFPVLEQA